jgi:uncharacterized protein (UPF0261 family)
MIVIPVTLDTKGEETKYIKEQIEKKGQGTLIVDVGVMGKPSIKADILREEVADKGGKSLKELVEYAKKGADRSKGTEVMIGGIKKIVKELYSSGKLDGVISLGGSTGTAIGVEAMKVLPIGVPKVMLTTDLDRADTADKDIMLIQAPADILGLNPIMKKALANAAGAVVGMLKIKKAGD